jgi:flavodoxin/ferredoxin
MRTLVIFFSQTGNTKTIAGQISEGIQAIAGHCDIATMTDVDTASIADYDLVGLGCPVFYFQEPLNVRSFIQSLPSLTGQHWFLFCTHGSIMGAIFHSMAKHLMRKEVVLIGFHDTYADAWLPFYPHPTLTTGHPDSQELEDARQFGRDIADRSRDVAAGRTDLIPALEAIPEEWERNAEMFTAEFMKRAFPALRINSAKCNECLDCEDGCPVDGIEIEAEPPRIQDPCVYCWHCVNVCPEAAVEADWSSQVKLAPKLYSRYRHWLDVAAERGEFRWQVDPDSIDFDNPYYLQRLRLKKNGGSGGLNE